MSLPCKLPVLPSHLSSFIRPFPSPIACFLWFPYSTCLPFDYFNLKSAYLQSSSAKGSGGAFPPTLPFNKLSTSFRSHTSHRPSNPPSVASYFTMCIRVIEVYAVCGCTYHVHGVDACAAYGQHAVADKTVQVGYACPRHAK
ncbi:hypothetical protein EJ06DRAFT_195624 [Trichodelitschia bisporula]|uniref:Uncharacterized protein n=1 Tax=Trichodelitschia bisporula TaxID=703511 RepID=A0A6G1I7Y2_9PEZI|nr:hypothetical protein EJ06DRAFT_195624 [Trichodelitschia bisporula]